MNCDYVYDGPSTKTAGFHRYRCRRPQCKLTANTNLGPHQIVSRCQGWPYLSEWREYPALILAALRIHRDLQRFLAYHFGPQRPLELDGSGPGNELALIFHSIRAGPLGPNCNDTRQKMNAWGSEGCRTHRDKILTSIKAKYDRTPRLHRVMCGFHAVVRRYPLSIPGMVDLALRRAEDGDTMKR